MGILIGVFSAAVFMDWRYYRIPNVCTAVGMANGLILTYMSFSWLGLARALGAAYPESRERLFYLMRYIRKAVLTGAMDDYETGQTKKRCVVRLSIPAFLSLLLMGAGVYR